MSEMFLQFEHPNGIHALVFEDDGDVAYAYFLEHKSILGDVWLYNRCPAPLEPAWQHAESFPPSKPFANPLSHVARTGFIPPTADHQITVQWDGPPESPMASVFIHGSLHATLKPGERPGRCKLASKNGPLAKVLSAEPTE